MPEADVKSLKDKEYKMGTSQTMVCFEEPENFLKIKLSLLVL